VAREAIQERIPTAVLGDVARPRRRGLPKDPAKSFAMTFLMVALMAGFLSPLVHSLSVSLKTPQQISQADAPIWPSDPRTFEYEGETYDVYYVPIDGQIRELALVTPRRTRSEFVDPAAPEAGLIEWQGSWRTLDRAWQFAPRAENYVDVFNLIRFPRLLLNTITIAIIGTIGTLVSCTLVAYGFARFRFPGRNLLFTVLIATIFLPAAVTLIPTYMIFLKLGWVGTWLPLLVPTFLANAYDVFLLRQYLLTIPRDLDEAAAIDGAGPLRTLISVILPQAWPAIIAVGIFHFVYSWNDFFGPLIYLSTNRELWTISLGLNQFNGIYFSNPGYVQAGTIMALVVPVLLFLIFQRFFTRGIVITGVEK
jgi:multiple sugar transport system permease protein